MNHSLRHSLRRDCDSARLIPPNFSGSVEIGHLRGTESDRAYLIVEGTADASVSGVLDYANISTGKESAHEVYGNFKVRSSSD